MSRLNALLVAALAGSVLVGCKAHTRSMPGLALTQPLQLESLDRADYQVLDAVEGQACRKVIGLFPIPIWFTVGSPRRGASVPFSGAFHPAYSAALHDALTKSEQADALMTPVWSAERRAVPPWFGETCVEVRARAIRIKDDAERAASGPAVDVDVDVKVKGAGVAAP